MDKEKLTQELQDIQLKLAINDWIELEGKKENEDIKNDSSYQPSVKARVKFNKLLNHHYKISKIKKGFKRTYKIVNKIAVAFLLIFLLFTVSVFSVEAVRVSVLNLFLSVQEDIQRLIFRIKVVRISLEINSILIGKMLMPLQKYPMVFL